MELKRYQTETLDVLRRFLEAAREDAPAAAYVAITGEAGQRERLRGFAGAYRVLNDDPALPYVCLRLPTGGGKTLLAAHACAVARDAFVERAAFPVLWMAPTDRIRRQTVDALRDPRHPYRVALAEAFGEPVRVFDIGDFAQITPYDLTHHLCVFVGTIQTLRTTGVDGRRVYAHNEALEPFFRDLPRRIAGLEPLDEAVAARLGADPADVRYSFANLLHLHRPLMIVDEAHTAVTKLSRLMQQRVNPCAVIEFTATPRRESNILHSVSARELRDAQMIKLPVVLTEHDGWDAAVTGALHRRAELAADAARDRTGYVRPIVLFQAEPKDREVTVDVLVAHLTEVHGLDRTRIAVEYADRRELNDVDLFSPDCPIDVIVTVEALKEGWDCSFAYVLCSVANIRNATDVEQLLGRVLRMPYAARRGVASLNRAYAHLVSKAFAEAANALRDKMVEGLGFSDEEAEDALEQPGLGGGAWFGEGAREPPVARIAVAGVGADSLAAAVAAAPGQISVDASGATPVLRVSGFLSAPARAAFVAALPEAVRAPVEAELTAHDAEHRRILAPAERGETFTVPGLCAWVQGELVFADAERFLEDVDWSLADCAHQLPAPEFTPGQRGDTFELDLAGRAVGIAAGGAAQGALAIADAGWTEGGLVAWLARQCRAPDILPGDLHAWLGAVTGFLLRDRRLSLAALMLDRFRLARLLRERIGRHRDVKREGAYQRFLFGDDARAITSAERGFVFRDRMFEGAKAFGGGWRFQRHFLGDVGAFDGVENGEELRAAQQLDQTPGVRDWVRNIARHPNAFRLPLGDGWTYPDFVARLDDGRLLVVEYKGAHLQEADADKRRAGELWARSGGGVYVFAVARDAEGRDVRAQIAAAIG